MARQVDFETSSELKRIFSRELEAWRQRHRLSLDDLSARCGVSPSYLAHIGRYGRIPSKPVLLLLGLNFGMQNPNELLRASNLHEVWPFDENSSIAKQEKSPEGFLSVKLDMAGFVEAIQNVVRSEIRPRTLRDLLNGRPLRIGLNPTQPWLFSADEHGKPDYTRGLLPDFCAQLENSLRCQISTTVVRFDSYVDKLRSGEIDVYGPMLAAPNNPANINFSVPLNRSGMSALMRTRETQGLDALPVPARFEDLKDLSYRIAVIKDSRAHLITNTRLNRSNDSLILCNTVEEALDRIMVRGVSRPAHIFICSAMNARLQSSLNPDAAEVLFCSPSTVIDVGDNAFAIRPDWPEAVAMINQAISFILGSGGFSHRLKKLADTFGPGVFEQTTYFPRAAND